MITYIIPSYGIAHEMSAFITYVIIYIHNIHNICNDYVWGGYD